MVIHWSFSFFCFFLVFLFLFFLLAHFGSVLPLFSKTSLLSYSLGVSLLNFLQLLLVTPATFSHTKLFSLVILFLSFHFFISLILHWHKLSAAFVYHNSSIIIPLTQSVFIFSFCNLLCQASIAFLLCYWAHYFQWGGAFLSLMQAILMRLLKFTKTGTVWCLIFRIFHFCFFCFLVWYIYSG